MRDESRKKDKYFDNLNLRKALSYAIDGEAIINLGDGSKIVCGIVSKGLSSNPKTVKDFVADSYKYKEFDEKRKRIF